MTCSPGDPVDPAGPAAMTSTPAAGTTVSSSPAPTRCLNAFHRAGLVVVTVTRAPWARQRKTTMLGGPRGAEQRRPGRLGAEQPDRGQVAGVVPADDHTGRTGGRGQPAQRRRHARVPDRRAHQAPPPVGALA